MKSLLLLLLCTAAALASAEVNLLKNPRFETTGKSGRPAVWQLRLNPENRGKISCELLSDPAMPGKVLHLATPPGDVLKDGNWMFQPVPVQPQRKYVLEFRAKAFAHDAGLDHSVNVGVSFQTADGGWISYKILSAFAKHSDKWKNSKIVGRNEWRQVRCEFTTPPRTGIAGLRLNISGAGAEAFFADFRLTAPEQTTRQVLERVPVPAEFKVKLVPVSAAGVTITPDWSIADAETVSSATRSRLCLNGLWALLVPGPNGELPPALDWAFFKVPGRPGDSRSPFEIYGNRANYRWKQSPFRWLWRTVELPTELPARRYFIQCDSLLGGAARIFWNGKPIGYLTDAWGGEVEIPAELLKRGEANTLALLVTGKKLNETTMHLTLSGKVPDIHEPTTSPSVGNVYLSSRPEVSYCAPPRITTSYRNRTLTVKLPGRERAAFYSIEVRDENGQTVLTADRLQSSGGQLTVPWENPVLWSPEEPNLLFLTLSASDASGRLLDRSLPERFGFRELWREGKELKFNGHPLRLRPRMGLWGGGTFLSDAFARRGISFLKDMGFNTLHRPGNERGEAELIRAADELGFFTIAYLPTALADGGQFGNLKTQPIDDTLLDYLDRHQIERFHNNPSVIAYSGFGAMMPLDQSLKYSNHPALWGIRPVDSDQAIEELKRNKVTNDLQVLRRQAAAISFIRGIRKLDGTRLFLGHVGCGTGDGWGSFDYLNHLPLQEWEDYVVQWSRHGVQPIGSTEHGHPYPMSFVNHGVPDGDSEPWHTEYCAALLGETAYRLERPEFRKLIRDIYDPVSGTFRTGAIHGHSAVAYTHREPAVQEYWAIHDRNIYRSWRLYGVNMGIEPFGEPHNYIREEVLNAPHRQVIATGREFLKQTGAFPDRFLQNDYFRKEAIPAFPEQPTGRKPAVLTPLGETLYANNHEFLGFVADRSDLPTAKTHIYAPGETVDKNLALIWDGLKPAEVTISGEIRLSGKVLEKIRRTVRLTPGEIRLFPFRFTIPADAGGTLAEPAGGSISVQFDCNGRESTDEFPFSVVAPPQALSRRVALFDPAGTAGAMKEFAAQTVTKPEELKTLNAELVMIAPEALTPGIERLLPKRIPVLVLPQKSATLERLGFRTDPIRSRRLFPDCSLAVAPELLRDWRAGTTFSTFSETAPWRPGHNNYIGSTGMVAGTVIEVPHFGNYTPLTHGEFDLSRTALLATEVNQAPWLFCQLELPANAAIDPAARALAIKLLDEFGKKPVSRQPVRLLGAEELGKRLELSQATESGLLLADRLEPGRTAELASFVKAGGTAVVMPQPDEVYRALGIPFTRTSGALFPAEIPGLNLGNFHYRQELPVVTFGGKVVHEQPVGKGKYLLVGFDPRRLDTEQAPWLMLTARRQYRALTQLLLNAGAAFAPAQKSLETRLSTVPRRYEIAPLAASFPLRPARDADSAWITPDYSTGDWQQFQIGKTSTGFPDIQLRIAFRLDRVPEEPLLLDAGSFDDFDICYLNGTKIGETTPANTAPEQAWKQRRLYPIPPGLLKSGENLLAIRAWNRNGKTRGWQVQIRGPITLRNADGGLPQPYFGKYRTSDDPYQLRQW